MEGQRISSYRVVRKIGQGGMGAVYEAVHEQLGRKAAIKLLRRELSQDPQIAMRFFNEARAASRVEHSGIVEIFEFGHLPDETAYIIMEFLRGEPLSARLRAMGGKLPLPDIIRISRQIASALAATHAKGIVHRDLKPDNVMLVPDSEMPGGERVKILDFGVAKVVTEYSGPGADDFKTNTGMVLGTASYMAPEQCKGAGSVSDKADVYSLGIVMYRMLVGHLPFRAEGQGEVMAMHIFSKARPLRELDPNIPEPMAALVERMMDKEQTNRPSMVQVAAELERMVGLGSPGGQPMMMMVSSPMSSGQMPTAPTLSAALGQNPGQASSDKSESVAAEPEKSSERSRLWSVAIALVVAGVVVAAGLHYGVVSRVVSAVHPPPPVVIPPPPSLVHWTLSSDPGGAQIVRKSDGMVLDKTPWSHERPAGSGKLTVILRAPGYADQELTFDDQQDQSPHVTLLPAPDMGAEGAADQGAAAAAADLAPAATAPNNPGTPATRPPATGPGPGPQPLRPQPPRKVRPTQPNNPQGTLTDDDVEIIK